MMHLNHVTWDSKSTLAERVEGHNIVFTLYRPAIDSLLTTSAMHPAPDDMHLVNHVDVPGIVVEQGAVPSPYDMVFSGYLRRYLLSQIPVTQPPESDEDTKLHARRDVAVKLLEEDFGTSVLSPGYREYAVKALNDAIEMYLAANSTAEKTVTSLFIPARDVILMGAVARRALVDADVDKTRLTPLPLLAQSNWTTVPDSLPMPGSRLDVMQIADGTRVKRHAVFTDSVVDEPEDVYITCGPAEGFELERASFAAYAFYYEKSPDRWPFLGLSPGSVIVVFLNSAKDGQYVSSVIDGSRTCIIRKGKDLQFGGPKYAERG
jgi:hypothetical protein